MHADVLVLQICDFLDDGDGFYRLHEPSRQLSRLPGVVVIDCHFYHRFLPTLVRAADVLVLPFVHNWDFFPLIEQRRTTGQVTVFEANDYFYDVQPWNPVSAGWQDRAIQQEYRHYMAVADAVQTSTAELARRWEPWSGRVAVFPNQLTHVPPLTPPPPRPLTIGWGGSPGHFADWYEVAPLLQRWLAAHPEVHLAVMCNEFAKPFVQLPAERYHFTPFGPLPRYLEFLGTLDIGLAPLLPTEYNRCRSDVKFLEYASHGVTGIYADLEPYGASVVPGETGLMYRSAQDLLGALDQLVSDPMLRQRIRTQAHAYVSRERRIESHIGQRLEFYRGLISDGPRGGEVPGDVIAAAHRDGNYLQLRPQDPEKAVLAAFQAPNPREAAALLRNVLVQHPLYLSALQQQGRLLNDLRDYHGALDCLDRALDLNVPNAQIRCEMGRARFGLKDIAGARRELEAGLALNPFYYPGWQYLLRLLALGHAGDGAAWVEQALARYPGNYVLALAGARLYPGRSAVDYLRRFLDDHGSSFKAEEKPQAAAAFSQTLREIGGPWLATPEGLNLLRRVVEIFPHSARLADLIGQVLHLLGEEEESRRHLLRALELRRSAVLYRSEFPEEDGRLHYWQFAETIQDCRSARRA
jgi:tetratricopeptide (TPR) repeat protein